MDDFDDQIKQTTKNPCKGDKTKCDKLSSPV